MKNYDQHFEFWLIIKQLIFFSYIYPLRIGLLISLFNSSTPQGTLFFLIDSFIIRYVRTVAKC